MAKKETVFFCKECGNESVRWLGQCPACKEWNTFVEAPKVKESKARGISASVASGSSIIKPVALSEVSGSESERITSDIKEFDRVLGGGIVPASLTLVGGDPGIGKSTLLLQVCKNLSDKGIKVLYVSGEESLNQIKLRADRIGSFTDNFKLLCETDLDKVSGVLSGDNGAAFDVLIIDSIQTMYRNEVDAAPGSVSQVRESTSLIMQLAKGLATSTFIVGHVTKEGAIAGPRMLEHMVDSVLYLEGDRHGAYRILRGVKNRFGSTNEIGVFEMHMDGLREVANPSSFLLAEREENACGSACVCLIEGTRPIMVEIQALVSRTGYGMARRTAVGIDHNRVSLLIAVIEKRLGASMADCDAYINIAGGMKISEPSVDLGIILALISSFKNKPVSTGTVVFGEVGLLGEVRAVTLAKARVLEAARLGFKTCIMPKGSYEQIKGDKEIKALKDVKLIPISTIEQLSL